MKHIILAKIWFRRVDPDWCWDDKHLFILLVSIWVVFRPLYLSGTQQIYDVYEQAERLLFVLFAAADMKFLSMVLYFPKGTIQVVSFFPLFFLLVQNACYSIISHHNGVLLIDDVSAPSSVACICSPMLFHAFPIHGMPSLLLCLSDSDLY